MAAPAACAINSFRSSRKLLLLHSQSALIARGRSNRQAKLLFYGKLAEKALGTYERDGWGEFPTQVSFTLGSSGRIWKRLAA